MKHIKFYKQLCWQKFKIKRVFTSFKTKNFSCKKSISHNLKSLTVYRFICTCYNSSYIGKKCCHFKIMIEENIKKDNKYQIFKYLYNNMTYFDSHNPFSFEAVDKTNSKFDVKIKEVLLVNWEKNPTQIQIKSFALILSL